MSSCQLHPHPSELWWSTHQYLWGWQGRMTGPPIGLNETVYLPVVTWCWNATPPPLKRGVDFVKVHRHAHAPWLWAFQAAPAVPAQDRWAGSFFQTSTEAFQHLPSGQDGCSPEQGWTILVLMRSHVCFPAPPGLLDAGQLINCKLGSQSWRRGRRKGGSSPVAAQLQEEGAAGCWLLLICCDQSWSGFCYVGLLGLSNCFFCLQWNVNRLFSFRAAQLQSCRAAEQISQWAAL